MNKGSVDKYWRDSKRDIFEVKDYPLRLRDQFISEWDDLAYTIKRGRIEKVQEYLKPRREYKVNTHFKLNGDTILHVAAEYN